MNLLRLEEPVRNPPRFDPAAQENIVAIDDLVTLFSPPIFAAPWTRTG